MMNGKEIISEDEYNKQVKEKEKAAGDKLLQKYSVDKSTGSRLINVETILLKNILSCKSDIEHIEKSLNDENYTDDEELISMMKQQLTNVLKIQEDYTNDLNDLQYAYQNVKVTFVANVYEAYCQAKERRQGEDDVHDAVIADMYELLSDKYQLKDYSDFNRIIERILGDGIPDEETYRVQVIVHEVIAHKAKIDIKYLNTPIRYSY